MILIVRLREICKLRLVFVQYMHIYVVYFVRYDRVSGGTNALAKCCWPSQLSYTYVKIVVFDINRFVVVVVRYARKVSCLSMLTLA